MSMINNRGNFGSQPDVGAVGGGVVALAVLAVCAYGAWLGLAFVFTALGLVGSVLALGGIVLVLTATRSIRTATGVAAVLAVAVCGYCAWSCLAFVFASLGLVGIVLALGGVGLVLAVPIVALFRKVRGRAVTVLFVPVGVLGGSFFLPGFPVVVALAFIGIGAVVTVYLAVAAVARSRVLAVLITAVPVVGAAFYVPHALPGMAFAIPKGLPGSGEVVRIGEPAAAPATPDRRLVELSRGLARTHARSAVISYQIRNNRLYADVLRDGAVTSVALDSRPLVQTSFPWLEHDLSSRLASILGPNAAGPAAQVAALLRPVAELVHGYDTVLVTPGALDNFPHQSVLQARQVIRSASLDQGRLEQNLASWSQPSVLRPEQVELFNGLPRSAEELRGLGLSPESWGRWQGLHEQFTEAVPGSVRGVVGGTGATRAAILNALQTKECVLFAIAHCDGVSIRLPNGDLIDVDDLNALADALRLNRPRVFLFSCDTARLNNVQSFAKALLERGARAVVAPVTKISTREALAVLRAFLKHALGDKPLPIDEAFRRALEEAGGRSMELWLGRQEGKRVPCTRIL